MTQEALKPFRGPKHLFWAFPVLEEKGESGVKRGYAYGQIPLDRHVLLVGRNSAGKTSLAKLAVVLLGLNEKEKRWLVNGLSFQQFYLRGNGVVGIAFSSPKRDLTVVVAYQRNRYQIYAVSDLLDVDFFLRRDEGRVLSLQEWVEKLRFNYGEPVRYVSGGRFALASKLVYIEGWENYLAFLGEPSLGLGVRRGFLPQYATLLAELFAEGEEGDILKTLRLLLLNSLEEELKDLEKNEGEFRSTLERERLRQLSGKKSSEDWKGVVRWANRWRPILRSLLPLEEELEGSLFELSRLERSAEEALPRARGERDRLAQEAKELDARKRALALEKKRVGDLYAKRVADLKEERGKALGALALLRSREEEARRAWESLSLSPEALKRLPLLETLLQEKREGLRRERSAHLASLEEEIRKLQERKRLLETALEERKRSQKRLVKEELDRERAAREAALREEWEAIEKRLRFLKKIRKSLEEMPARAEGPRNPYALLRALDAEIAEKRKAIGVLQEKSRALGDELSRKEGEAKSLREDFRALEREEGAWLKRREELLAPQSLYRALEASSFPWKEKLGPLLSPSLLGEKGLYASWEEYREDWGLFGLQLHFDTLPPFQDPLDEVAKALRELEAQKAELKESLDRVQGEIGALGGELEEVSKRLEELSRTLRETERERAALFGALEARRERALRWVGERLRRAEEAEQRKRSEFMAFAREWFEREAVRLEEVERRTDPELEALEREIARLRSSWEALKNSEGLEGAYREVEDLEREVEKLRRGAVLFRDWEAKAKELSESGEVFLRKAEESDRELARLEREWEEREREFGEAEREVERLLQEAQEASLKVDQSLKVLLEAMGGFQELREELDRPQVPPFLRETFASGESLSLSPEGFVQEWESWGRNTLKRARGSLGLLVDFRTQLATMDSVADIPSVARKDRARVIAQELESRAQHFYKHLWGMRVQLETVLNPMDNLRKTVQSRGVEIRREVLKGRFPQAEWFSFEVSLDLDSAPWYQKGLELVEKLRSVEAELAQREAPLFSGPSSVVEEAEKKALRLYEELLELAERESFTDDLRRLLSIRGVVRKLDVSGRGGNLVPIERQRDLKSNFSRGTAYLLRASLAAGFLRGLLGSWDGLSLPLVLDEVSVVDPKGLRILLDLMEELGFRLLGTTPHRQSLLSDGVEAVFVDKFRAVPAVHPARKEDLRAKLSPSL